jgi:hypothetical protein
MNIFKEIKSNIYDKEYYKGIPNETFSKSIKYLFRLSLIGGLLSLVIFMVMSREMPNMIKTEVVKLVNEYPEELVITVENGQASINKEEPYMLPMSEDTKKLMEESENKSTYSNALVIDTKNPFNIENFKKYNTFGLLTKEEIVFMNGDTGEIRIFPLKDIKENKQTLASRKYFKSTASNADNNSDTDTIDLHNVLDGALCRNINCKFILLFVYLGNV